MSSEHFSIPPTPVTTPGQANPPKARAAEVLADKRTDAPETPDKEKDTDWKARQAESTVEANQGLLQAMFGKAKNSSANAQKINYQEVVTQLEEVLRKELGDENFSLDKLAAKTSGVEGEEDYWSPERTADRIYTGATGYFEAFKKQHPDLSEEEVLDKFLSIIAPAIDKGFDEAADILQGFNVFEGDIESNARRTQELVHEKLAVFREEILGTQGKEKDLIDDSQGEK
ncbi:DUF5610 domain-containing protein [Marinospirillum sp.]|uniref:DUF5610 domain-containing protein n=1 Tax=Marinospirillum sp. TaxID=2183934 RepID=UPI00384C1EB1